MSTHACLPQFDECLTCKPVIVSVVSSNPTGGEFFFRHLDANFYLKMTEMSDLCSLRKPQILALLPISSSALHSSRVCLSVCDGVLVCPQVCGRIHPPRKINPETYGRVQHLTHQPFVHQCVMVSQSVYECVASETR